MEGEKLDAMLKDEYFYVQKVIEDFDSRAIAIKAWSVSFSFAAIGGAFASHAGAVLLVASVSALLFWLLEALWKSFQAGYYRRVRAIERHFAGEAPLTSPLQIADTWFRHWQGRGSREWTRMLLWPHVALPHVVVAIIGATLFVLSVTGTIRP